MLTDPSDLYGQYVLAAQPIVIDGWAAVRVAGLHLSAHPALPVVPITVGGAEAGVLLGWPVSAEGRLVTRLTLPASYDPVAAAYEHGGRWLLITADAIYLDPAGSQPAVYSTELGVVASSPGLIAAEDDEALVAAFDVVSRDGWYPFGLTPKRGVRRLLPNHALDLATFEVRRHHSGPEPGSGSVEMAATAALAAVQAVANAFTPHGLAVGLTAGKDSRLLLAALRPYLGSAQFFTNRARVRGNATDINIARRLAKRFRLQHAVMERVPASGSELRAWLDRVGWTRAGARATIADWEVAEGVFLHGAAGELARAFYAHDEDYTTSAMLTPEEACARIKAPREPRVLMAAAAWLDGLPARDRLHALDLLYLEQRLGCWAGPGNLGRPLAAPALAPLNRRDALDAMLALSPEAKRASAFVREGIQQAWPELLSLPFNAPVGLAKVRRDLGRLPGNLRFRLGALRRRLHAV